jgi:hypothetical protein
MVKWSAIRNLRQANFFAVFISVSFCTNGCVMKKRYRSLSSRHASREETAKLLSSAQWNGTWLVESLTMVSLVPPQVCQKPPSFQHQDQNHRASEKSFAYSTAFGAAWCFAWHSLCH